MFLKIPTMSIGACSPDVNCSRVTDVHSSKIWKEFTPDGQSGDVQTPKFRRRDEMSLMRTQHNIYIFALYIKNSKWRSFYFCKQINGCEESKRQYFDMISAGWCHSYCITLYLPYLLINIIDVIVILAHTSLTPSMPASCSKLRRSKGRSAPCWSNPQFLIFDIQSCQRMSKIKNGGLDQYGKV